MEPVVIPSRLGTPRSPVLLLLTAALVMSPGCILSHDFTGASATQTKQDAGRDASSDAGRDTNVDTDGQDAGVVDAADAGGSEGTLIADNTPCSSDVPVFRVATNAFGDAKDALFAGSAPTHFDIGPPADNVFSAQQKKTTHAIAVVAATSDNKLAVGWASIDTDGQQPPDAQAVGSATVKFAGGTIAPVTGATSGGALEVYSVEVFPANNLFGKGPDGQDFVYSFLVATNAGTYDCKVYGDPNGDQLDNVASTCQVDTAIKNALSADLTPARRFQWLPLKNSLTDYVITVEGGADHHLGVFLLQLQLTGPRVDRIGVEGVDTQLGSGGFFGLTEALGWPEYAHKKPLLYMLDHSTTPPRPVELANGGPATSTGTYQVHSGADAFAMPATLDESAGHFAFAYQLGDGAANGTITPGYVGVDRDGGDVVFGGLGPIEGNDWLRYSSADVDRVWTFATGGPALVALAHGNTDANLELGSWNMKTQFRSVSGVVRPAAHHLGQLDQLNLDATWQFTNGFTNFTNPPALPGLLGFAAADTTGGRGRGLYVISLPDVHDAKSLCH